MSMGSGRRLVSLACRAYSSSTFRGVFPPVATPFTPDAANIDIEGLEKNLGKLGSVSLSGYVAMGSNGEYLSLSESESVQLVETVSHIAKQQNRICIAGAGRESTAHTIRLCKEYAKHGADYALVITPFYYTNQYQEREYLSHFREVADKSPIPVLLYNVPANTNVDLSLEVISQLASHPNIAGIKESGGDVNKIEKIVKNTRDQNFSVIAGSAGFFLPSLKVGASGCVPALGNVLGESICDMLKNFEDANLSEAEKIHEQIQEPNVAVTRKFGVPGLKTAMTWFGYTSGLPRKPLLPLTEENEKNLRETFKPFIPK